MTATITRENPKVHIGKKCKFQVTSIQNYEASKNYVIKVVGCSDDRLQYLECRLAPIIHPLSGKIVFMSEPITWYIEYFELLNAQDYPVLVNYSVEYSSIWGFFLREVKNSYVFF